MRSKAHDRYEIEQMMATTLQQLEESHKVVESSLPRVNPESKEIGDALCR